MKSPLIRFPAELVPALHALQRPRETLPDTIRRVVGPALDHHSPRMFITEAEARWLDSLRDGHGPNDSVDPHDIRELVRLAQRLPVQKTEG